MNKEQAIDLLRQLAENYRGTYQEHKQLQGALTMVGDSEATKVPKKPNAQPA